MKFKIFCEQPLINVALLIYVRRAISINIQNVSEQFVLEISNRLSLAALFLRWLIKFFLPV